MIIVSIISDYIHYYFYLQELTQEKHELRLRLENIETEYENTVKELQSDIALLRHDLEEQQEQSRQGDRTKSQIVHELTQQNERLTEQLKKVSYHFFNISCI